MRFRLPPERKRKIASYFYTTDCSALFESADQNKVACDKMEKYCELIRIGEGSFGRVYKATEVATKKTVALKVITKVGDFIEK